MLIFVPQLQEGGHVDLRRGDLLLLRRLHPRHGHLLAPLFHRELPRRRWSFSTPGRARFYKVDQD